MYFFLNPGLTGLEPATSAVTGRCSNQLNYKPIIKIFCINNALSKLNLQQKFRWRLGHLNFV